MATKKSTKSTLANSLAVDHYDNHAFVHFDDLIPIVQEINSGGGGGGGGTTNYNDLSNKPSIENVTLTGNKTLSDIGAVSSSDLTNGLATKWDTPSNSTTLLKFGEDLDGNPTYDGDPIGGSSIINLIGAYDIYDTTERIIGVYMGKPLYRNCAIITETSTSNNVFQLPNLDKIIRLDCVHKNTSNGNCNQVPSFAGDMSTNSAYLFRRCRYSNDTGYVIVDVYSVAADNIDMVTVEYTKTTDATSTVSYGHENEYSTTEKIVGTWIDGSLVYQITIVVTGVVHTSGTETPIDNSFTVSGTINPVSISAIIRNSATMANQGATPNYITIRWIAENGDIYARLESSLGSGTYDVIFTIQYTKTSS